MRLFLRALGRGLGSALMVFALVPVLLTRTPLPRGTTLLRWGLADAIVSVVLVAGLIAGSSVVPLWLRHCGLLIGLVVLVLGVLALAVARGQPRR